MDALCAAPAEVSCANKCTDSGNRGIHRRFAFTECRKPGACRCGRATESSSCFEGGHMECDGVRPTNPLVKFLDTKWPLPPGAVGRDQCLTVAKKVCLNQCTAAPLNNAGFYSWVLMWQHITDEQGDHSQGLLEDIGTKLTNDLPQTTVNSCLVWGTAWTINMLFLPPHTRVLFNSVGQVFWTAYLSFTGHRRL